MPMPATRATRHDHLTDISSSVGRGNRRRALPRNTGPAIPQIEIQGPELERRLELDERACAVVAEPDFRASAFAEDARRLDHGPNDDRVEAAGGYADGLLSYDDEAHGILVGAEVAGQLISLPHLERNASQKKEE